MYIGFLNCCDTQEKVFVSNAASRSCISYITFQKFEKFTFNIFPSHCYHELYINFMTLQFRLFLKNMIKWWLDFYSYSFWCIENDLDKISHELHNLFTYLSRITVLVLKSQIINVFICVFLLPNVTSYSVPKWNIIAILERSMVPHRRLYIIAEMYKLLHISSTLFSMPGKILKNYGWNIQISKHW